MKISSNAFESGQMIPEKYTCKGANINPELKFSGVSSGAKSLALIMHDPDAPRAGGFTHWVIFNMPPNTTRIPENSKPSGVEGKNDAGKNNYIGPCPPSGTHRYYFKLYALDTMFLENFDMQGHVIEEAELMGKFNK